MAPAERASPAAAGNATAGRVTVDAPLPKQSNDLGDLAEAKFINEAISRGFRVCKPYGDSSPFDFIVEKRGRMLRIQVKSTAHEQGRKERYFQIQSALSWRRGQAARPYGHSETDFIVGYVFPCDAWYVIPIRAVQVTGLHVRPGLGTGRFEKYREAWHLLESARFGREGSRVCCGPAEPHRRQDSSGKRPAQAKTGLERATRRLSPDSVQLK